MCDTRSSVVDSSTESTIAELPSLTLTARLMVIETIFSGASGIFGVFRPRVQRSTKIKRLEFYPGASRSETSEHIGLQRDTP